MFSWASLAIPHHPTVLSHELPSSDTEPMDPWSQPEQPDFIFLSSESACMESQCMGLFLIQGKAQAGGF